MVHGRGGLGDVQLRPDWTRRSFCSPDGSETLQMELLTGSGEGSDEVTQTHFCTEGS